MSVLFERVIRFQFAKPGETPVLVDELYMQFDGEKTLEAEPNRFTVKIHNLGPSSAAKLQRKGVLALMEVGYRGDSGSAPVLKKLFVGQIKTAAVETEGRESISKIEFQDGIDQYSESMINMTLGPGATNRQVLETLAQKFGTGLGAVKGLQEGTFQQGVTLAGPVREKLDDLTRRMGLEWSIQNNNLQILPPKVPSELLGYLLSPSTGLIGSPTQREDAKSGGKFLEFKCLMNAAIYPGVAVQIKSKKFDGIFKVRKAHYEGDNRRGPFQMTCEAQELLSGVVPPNVALARPTNVRGLLGQSTPLAPIPEGVLP